MVTVLKEKREIGDRNAEEEKRKTWVLNLFLYRNWGCTCVIGGGVVWKRGERRERVFNFIFFLFVRV